jgi:thiamine-phosphate pyrophosphorylase
MDKRNLLLYAITDCKRSKDAVLYEQIEQALCGGATLIQLREKEIDEYKFEKEIKEIKKLCNRFSVPLIINDYVELALRSGADGVHVGKSDMPVDQIRKLAGKDFIIGATTKTIEQAKAAEENGADYLGVGAVFPTNTKENVIRITIPQLKEIALSTDLPSVAIGGIKLSNMHLLNDCGADGIAVVTAVFAADDIKKATEELRKEAEKIIHFN